MTENVPQKSCDCCSESCSCIHHLMVPILVVVFGLIFLLGNLDVINSSTVGLLWPIVVMVGGLTAMFGGKCKCC
jgi:hypothetical protein